MDDLYLVARRVLLDALEALGPHRDAVVVVGAQAVYLRVGEADFAVAPYTEDGDLALDPALLGEEPALEVALAAAGFVPRDVVGTWLARRAAPSGVEVTVPIDLLVPEAVSPRRGKRAAGLRGHQSNAARNVPGLEGALVDHDWLELPALDPQDARTIRAKVAGAAALLVAKLHKIDERKGSRRVEDKDALDVFRLLRGTPAPEVAARMRLLVADQRSAEPTRRSIGLLGDLFRRVGAGSDMAVRASAGLIDADEVRVSCEALSEEIVALMSTSR